jgi:hypothetical protein
LRPDPLLYVEAVGVLLAGVDVLAPRLACVMLALGQLDSERLPVKGCVRVEFLDKVA